MDRSGANPNMQPLGQRGQGRAEFEQQQRSRGSSRGGRGGAGGRGGGGGGRGRGAGRGRGRGGGRGGGRGPPRRSPSTTASMMEKRRKTQMVEEVKKELELLNLEIGDPHMEEKRPPGTAGVPTKVRTNVYGIKMQKRTVFRYDITISGVPVKKKGPARAPPPAKVEFTKRTKDDCVVVDRRDFCRVAFLMYVEKHKDVFGSNPSALYYDLQSILYTLEELNFGPDKSEDTYVLGRDECESTKELKGFHRVSMLVRKVNKVVELDDLSMLSNDMSQQNHTLPQFLELATSQCALQTPQEHVILGRGTTYLIHPENYGFVPKDGPPLSEKNKYLAIGVHKSIRYVEGPDGRDSKKVGLIVESKKTPFHNADANVFEKTVTIIGGRTGPGGAVPPNKIPYLNQQLKNLHVSIQYPNSRTRNILVSGVSVKSAANHIIEVQGEKVTVQEYYRRKYGYEMEHPHAPLLTAQEDRQINFYPMEICTPRDNQRAQLSQLNAREVATMIKSCAVPPPQLKRQIESSVQALDLQGSDYLREAGIEVKKPLVAKGRRLPAPTILFGQGKDSAVDRDSGKWPLRDIFYLPATIQKWAAFLILAEGNRDDHHHFEQEQMDNFIRTFMKMCRSFGMTIPMPCFVSGIPPTEEEVERTIVCARDEACDFVFYITSDAITHLHAIIKASEQKYQIVTQDLKLSNAAEIAHRGKAETVRNIVAKTNEKMGGINYSLKLAPSVQTLIDEGTLFIGLGISHPGAMGNYERARGATPVEPSVIGYAANMKKDPFDFVGDYLFDEPRRDEKFSTMAKITQTCVLRYQEQRSELPRRLILFRNGTSEGQFQTTLQYEVPLVRHALNECAASDCKITVIVTQKMHNIRLFEEPMPAEEEAGRRNLNIKPGTVVDTQVTHPMQNEFYLNSHVAIQGTTRTPRYSILLDDSKFSMDDIEQMCYALSYCYKIINSPTSLPAPVYIALMYAKRGRTIYQANKNNVSEITQANGQPDHEEISHRLGYGGTKLKDNRINA